jgi:solute carrier family 39 (zinc transporter), member 7
MLKILLAFAVGGLLGDVFLHLLPHAAPGHDHHHDHHEHEHHEHEHHEHEHHEHDHEHDHEHEHKHEHGHEGHDHSAELFVGLWVLMGLLSFFAIEKFVRAQHAKHGGHGHSHGAHSHGAAKCDDDDDDDNDDGKRADKKSGKKGKVVASSSDKKNKKTKKDDDDTDDKKKKDKDYAVGKSGIAVSGWLNLAADFTHNFTDGMAIAASFGVSTRIGLISTAAILFHEVPHEIGDYAILVQAGFSHYRAAKAQLSTAIGALLGTVLGLLAEGATTGGSAILPFTAGGFIYIATTSIIPVLLEDTSMRQSILEILAILVGIGSMVVIALIE